MTAFLLVAALLAADTDRIRLEIVVKDDVSHRLVQPVATLDALGSDPIPLLDDGSLPGDTPQDAIYTGVAMVRRMPRVTFAITDAATGQTLGTQMAFLPAASEARLVYRTTQGDPAIVMDSVGGASPTGDGSVPAPVAGTATTGSGAGERFAWLLWVVLVVGLLGFGYLRVVVRRLYLQDFLPTWKKLDAWLDAEARRRGGEG